MQVCTRFAQVVLGHQYTMAIDMWSLGCVAAELFLGLPLFPGASEHDLLSRIVEMMGPPPSYMLAAAKNTDKYFRRFETVVQGHMGASTLRPFCKVHVLSDRVLLSPRGLRLCHGI
jgi:serine/threonine protein kinase